MVVASLGGLATLSGCGDLLTGDSDGRNNYAVVVGISSYQAPSLAVKWGDEDALDFYDALRHSKNWEADKITLLTNGAATHEAIKGALTALTKRVGSDDQVVFYFSGRGSFGPDQPPFDESDGLDEYLMPYDAQPGTAEHDLIDDELEALFAALPTSNVLIVLDTSFGVGATQGNPVGKDRGFARSGRALPRTLDGMNHDLGRPGYILVTASQPADAAYESNVLRNGVFSYYLVEGMLGAANPGKKVVTALQAFEYANTRTRSHSAQAPQFIDNRGKVFRLASF